MGNETHHAMKNVLEDMGRAAREGRARRFTKRPAKGVDVTVGDVTLEPSKDGASAEVDPVKEAGMTPAEMAEMLGELDVQR